MAAPSDSFQCGPFEVARNPDVRQFVEKLNRLREAVDQNRLQPGVGYTLSRTPGGTVLSLQAGTASAQEPPPAFPFQVTTFTQGGVIFYRVEKESGVVGGLKVQNLGVGMSTERRDLNTPVRVILSANIAPGPEPTGVTVRHQLATDPYSEVEPGLVELSGPQTRANLLLATLTSTGIVQNVRTNVTLLFGNVLGYPGWILRQL